MREAAGVELGSLAEKGALLEGSAGEESEAPSAISSATRRQEMVFGLKALLEDSERILKFLASEEFPDYGTLQGFQTPDSWASKSLRKLLKRLRVSCEDFEDSEDLVPFDVKTTVQKLIGARHWQEVGDGQWRPDALFQMANLVTFAVEILGPSAQTGGEYGVLEIMRDQFPSPFTYGFKESAESPLNKGYSNLLRETFEVGLEIRTQCAISLMLKRRAERNFDPDDVLDQIFYLGDEEITQLTGFRVEGLSVEDRCLPKKFENEVLERIQTMKVHFSEHIESSVDIRSLQASFPWQNFIAKTISWVQARAAELSQQISFQGGIDEIQRGLAKQSNLRRSKTPNKVSPNFLQESADLNNQVETSALDSTTTTSGLPVQTKGKAKSVRKSLLEEAKRLKQLTAQLPQGFGLAAKPLQEARSPRSMNVMSRPPPGNGFDEPPRSSLTQLLGDPSVEVGPVAEVVTTIEIQSRQSNKENIDTRPRPKTLLDRQDGAQRIQWEEEGEEVHSGNRRTHKSHRKRGRDLKNEDGHDDGEDAFGRTIAVAPDRRRKELRDRTGQHLASHNSSSSRHPPEIPESVHGQDEIHQHLGSHRARISVSPRHERKSQRPPSPSQPSRYPPMSSHSTNTPASSSPPPRTAQQIAQVREMAKRNVGRIKPRDVQSRSPYDEREEMRLLELIEDYGTSYALIKQMDDSHPDGPLLQNRTQVQLKDKAMEMKFSWLK